jgi:C4-dicarboxylate transporter DctM subunit
MYKALASLFDAVDAVASGISSWVRRSWRVAWQGPLQQVAFVLILCFTGLRLVLERFASGLDRVVAWLEKAFLAVAMLAMVFLSFFDYLQREGPEMSFDIPGGPNMAMVLMVWVGFLGASLATRQGKHLSVDATERLLSPGAAKMAQRFSALVAAGLCWKLMTYSWTLTTESLEYGDRMEGLVVWGFIVSPINWFIAHLPVAGEVHWTPLLGGLAVACGSLAASNRFQDREDRAGTWAFWLLEALAGIAGLFALMAFLPLVWEPTLEFGDPVTWQTVKAGDGFPLWLCQFVLPLSFGLMAVRFSANGLLGRVGTVTGRGEIAPPAHAGGNRTGRDIFFAGLMPGVLIGLCAGLVTGTGWLIGVAGVSLVLVGAPLFTAIGVAALSCVMLISDLSGVSVATDMFEATKKQELLAIPFFVLAGAVMTQGSIADRLIGVARAILGPVPGGLGLATIFACCIFAAISGSSPVTVIAIGTILFPMLTRERYPEDYSLGVLTSAGSLGIIIPPSVPMIVYAIMVSTPQNIVSPSDLFMAGILPGLFIASVLALYTIYRTRPGAPGIDLVPWNPEGGYWVNLFRQLRRGVLAMVLPILILGGIYGWLGPLRFTVTEAAAVAVVYALTVELFIHRELKFHQLPKVLTDSGVMMGTLFLIIVLAIAFNKFLTFQEIPQQAAEWLAGQIDSQWKFLILVNLFLLVLGCIMEILSAILIVAPLLAPIAANYGMDPVHFGIMFIVNLELGYLTPPMGINLFVASTVFDRPIVTVIKAAFPFLLLMLFCLAVIAWFPQLSLALL